MDKKIRKMAGAGVVDAEQDALVERLTESRAARAYRVRHLNVPNDRVDVIRLALGMIPARKGAK